MYTCERYLGIGTQNSQINGERKKERLRAREQKRPGTGRRRVRDREMNEKKRVRNGIQCGR